MAPKKSLEKQIDDAMLKLGVREIVLHYFGLPGDRDWNWRVDCLPLHHRVRAPGEADKPVHTFTVKTVDEIPDRLLALAAAVPKPPEAV